MTAKAAQQKSGYALIGATVLAYFSRPWSCDYVLSQFTTEDPLPYAHFDNHGILAIFGWATALIFAIPILWLAKKLFLDGTATFRIFGRASDSTTTAVSIFISLAIAAPMLSQMWYLIGLPIGVSFPVGISSIVWLLIVELGRSAAVDGRRLSKQTIWVSAIVAVLATIPKLGIIALRAIDG